MLSIKSQLSHAMPKAKYFINMKSSVFLILLLDNFIPFIFCIELTNDSEEVCPVTWFRRKRSNIEYTRWRSNIDTTSEFIVKVLDDEITTSGSNQIVAVNILPVTNRGEKIIVGGAMVPPPTASSSADLPKDYTRFVPPTTSAAAIDDDDIYRAMASPPPVLDGDALAPIKPESIKEAPFFPLNPERRNIYRDESPPASPQFIAPVPTILPARQYAPIAPVAFTRRTTVTPFTPPIYDRFNPFEAPTRSSASHTGPSRTVPEDFPFFHGYLDGSDKENEVVLTRTTTKDGPLRTTSTRTTEIKFNDDDIKPFHTSIKYALDQIAAKNYDEKPQDMENDHLDKDPDLKNSETSYNPMFLYNDDLDTTQGRKSMDYEDKDKQDSEFPQKLIGEGGTSESKSTTDDVHTSSDYPADNNNTIDEPFYTDVGMEVPENSSDSITGIPSMPESRDKRRPICNMIKLRQLNFNSPRTLPEIVSQLKQWAEESPITRWVDITEGNLTTMENPIYMVIVDDTSVGQVASEKLNAFIIAGIQGRDHHAVASAMYILYQLIERSETHYDLLGKYRFWIIPVFNPDGYDYSMTFPHRREWMKNLRQTWDICKGRESCKHCDTHGLRCSISPCYGVNLDRNFEYQWIPTEELRAEHPCGNLYAGTRQLSEIETSALSNYLHRMTMSMNIFIAFKEGDVLGVMYPHSHIRKRRPFDNVYRQRAGRAAASAYSIAGRPYVAGQTSEFLPLYAGGIEDWADGHLGVDSVYTVMMFRPADSHHSKVITERVVHEAYAAMDSLLLSSLMNTQRPPIITLAKGGAYTKHSTSVIFLTILVNFCYS